jgi:hypothetical protein
MMHTICIIYYVKRITMAVSHTVLSIKAGTICIIVIVVEQLFLCAFQILTLIIVKALLGLLFRYNKMLQKKKSITSLLFS